MAGITTHTKYVLATLLAIALQTGCSTEKTDSVNIATRAIWAGINVDANRAGSTRVNVELNVGGINGTNIVLAGNERLEASVGSQVQTLQKDTDFLDIDYEATFNTSSSALPFRITFYRDDGGIFSGSVINLPDEFVITSPASGQIYSLEDSLPILWSAPLSGRSIEVQFNTRCQSTMGGTLIGSKIVTFTDDGFENYGLLQIESLINSGVDRTQNCELEIRLTRESFGTLDPGFEAGGSISGTQSRSVENLSVSFPTP